MSESNAQAAESSAASPVVTTVVNAAQMASAARTQAAEKIADLYKETINGPGDEWTMPATAGDSDTDPVKAGEPGKAANADTKTDTATATTATDALADLDEQAISIGREFLGMSEESMREMAGANPAAFKRLMDNAVSGWQRLAAGFQELRTLQDGNKSNAAAGAEAPKPVAGGVGERARRLAEKLGLDEDGTQELAALVEDGVKPLKQQVESLRGEREAEAREREGAEFVQSIERAFASLGDEERFGKGSIGAVTPAQQKARREVAVKARAMVVGARGLGQSIGVEEAVRTISHAHSYQDMKKRLEAQARDSARNHQGRFTIPPSRTRSGDGVADRQIETVDRVRISRSAMAEVADAWNKYQGRG